MSANQQKISSSMLIFICGALSICNFQYRFFYIHEINWRASEASETLSGVVKLKIGDIFLLASETVLGVDNAKLGICYI